jgi:hypothetical protein
MALIGTATNGQSSSLGSWCEVTSTGALTITANAETPHTVTLPAGSNILSTLPIMVCVLLAGATAINGGSHNCGTGIGVRTTALAGSTLTITFAADAAAAATIPLGARFIIYNVQGV